MSQSVVMSGNENFARVANHRTSDVSIVTLIYRKNDVLRALGNKLTWQMKEKEMSPFFLVILNLKNIKLSFT